VRLGGGEEMIQIQIPLTPTLSRQGRGSFWSSFNQVAFGKKIFQNKIKSFQRTLSKFVEVSFKNKGLKPLVLTAASHSFL
jgi:hypothetical protein